MIKDGLEACISMWSHVGGSGDVCLLLRSLVIYCPVWLLCFLWAFVLRHWLVGHHLRVSGTPAPCHGFYDSVHGKGGVDCAASVKRSRAS